jgi:hypothetical protein
VPRPGSPYGGTYPRARSVLLRQRLPCALRLACDGAMADSADHDPPLALHEHVAGSGCCRLVPACLRCQSVQDAELVGFGRFELFQGAGPRAQPGFWPPPGL